MDALREIETEVLRPIHAEELVGEDGHWRFNACVNWAGDASELYVDGYRMAALRLVEQLGPGDQDFLIYPIVFLYRHYLELRLKDIVALGAELSPNPGERVPATHDLRALWERAKTHLRREYKSSPEYADFLEDVEAAGRLIEKFAELDPGATSFRYAMTKGQPSLPKHLYRINLRQFADAMSKLGHFLDGASAGLGHAVGEKREFEQELASYE